MKLSLSIIIISIIFSANETLAESNTKKNTALYGYAMNQIAKSFCNKSIDFPVEEIEFIQRKIKEEPETKAKYDQIRLTILNQAQDHDICLIVAQYAAKNENSSNNSSDLLFKDTVLNANPKYEPTNKFVPSHLYTGYVYNQSDKDIASIYVTYKFFDCPQKNNCFLVDEQKAELYDYGAPTLTAGDFSYQSNLKNYRSILQKRTRKHFVAFISVPEHTRYEVSYTYTFLTW